MRIDHTAFGQITIDGKTYEHDVIIWLSGKVAQRRQGSSWSGVGTYVDARSCTEIPMAKRKQRALGCAR